ncbi:MAG: EAL domain-containing protein, partial [Waterburya sp.]
MLNMGQPVKIVDLARDLINLSGYEVGKDIDIVFTGLRPGEKLYEELLVEGEEYEATTHEKVLVVKDASRIIPPNLDTTIDVLCQAAKRNDINLIVFLLDRLVVGYTSKYQQIDVEQAQDSLEQIISETHELNSITVGLQPEFMPRSSSLSSNSPSYVTRLTPTELQRSLKQALENEEFSLYYQPVMSLITGRVIEVEALLRWHHPHLGLISPQKFIAVAEESGLIVPLQRWIIEAVCSQLKCWQEDRNFNRNIGISINVPSIQLLQASLVKHLKFNLEKHQLPSHLITWEISEYLISENLQEASIILPQLKQLGIQLQIDNFGRVSSIYGGTPSNLLYQEFDRAKIDRYLVNQIAKDQLTWDMFRKIVLDL